MRAGARNSDDPWLRRMLAEQPLKLAAAALANKMARIIRRCRSTRTRAGRRRKLPLAHISGVETEFGTLRHCLEGMLSG